MLGLPFAGPSGHRRGRILSNGDVDYWSRLTRSRTDGLSYAVTSEVFKSYHHLAPKPGLLRDILNRDFETSLNDHFDALSLPLAFIVVAGLYLILTVLYLLPQMTYKVCRGGGGKPGKGDGNTDDLPGSINSQKLKTSQETTMVLLHSRLLPTASGRSGVSRVAEESSPKRQNALVLSPVSSPARVRRLLFTRF